MKNSENILKELTKKALNTGFINKYYSSDRLLDDNIVNI